MRALFRMSAILVAALLIPCETLLAQDHRAVPAIVDRKTVATPQGRMTTGRFRVFENRDLKTLRTIHLDFVILHTASKHPKPDPYFFFAGGPGQAASVFSRGYGNSRIRKDRDIVLINQRGTGGDNKLSFLHDKSEVTLQPYLDPLWQPELVKANRDRLARQFDLRMYSTPTAMDDVYDFCQAMGYKKINIAGGSYGTRACLVYARRHPETVRTIALFGCAPIEFRNPLYHAEGGQRALSLLFDEVKQSEKYRAVFGDLETKFNAVLKRLGEKPARVEVMIVSTGKSETVQLTRSAFESSVRSQMYGVASNRSLPRLICEAYEGNCRPFVIRALKRNIALRDTLALGMLLSVTTAEDVARIREEDIGPLTKNTFTGDYRVRTQMAAAALWPKSKLPTDYGKPIKSDIPTLIFSGHYDPVTPPKWGAMIYQNFTHSLHVVVPQAHDIGGPIVDQIQMEFLKSGSVVGLNTDGVESMVLPPLELPPTRK